MIAKVRKKIIKFTNQKQPKLKNLSKVNRIILPPNTDRSHDGKLGDTRQLTIIGGNGAGKSRFMDEMISLCGDRAYCLSALSAFYAEREESTLPGSIDSQYRRAVSQQSYMRTDAVSELDKIVYMLFADELESLLEMKAEALESGKRLQIKPTKLDIIKKHWERIFPGNSITRSRGSVMFATRSGNDLITTHSLSQGEKAVLYYLGAAMYAPTDAVIFIDSPSLFIHPTIIGTLWNSIEELRPDCTFVYNSVDEDFVSTRTNNTSIWVKRYDSQSHAWEYEVIAPGSRADELMVEFAGSRRPVLFIEGDMRHSIDVRLYSLVFPDMTVRPLGSCNKVIETTRSFNDQQSMHHLRSYGIVDRDRRTEHEVEYLRNKMIMVPDVAEVENIFLLPGVIKLTARRRGRDPERVMRRVHKEVMRMFRQHTEEQVLQHVRHRVKREVECKIDARFKCITALETHLRGLVDKLQPRKQYKELREEFAVMVRDDDYESVLRVFNHKPMLSDCGVAQQLGFKSKDEYIGYVLDILKSRGKDSEHLRQTVRHALHIEPNGKETENR